ncbi:hypothetical protein Pr1d_29110 [Bythopirellula goksoeyrii]|uniref:Uncharacterized protein n=1 Tax=Bythopirellula goksoeyrii TaxID=1400387 RepID=A0A5B9QCT1_9BACT|nr:hypothetical protein Pr1d_29110 [Bythopirellula goksoeyrii]
MSAEPIAFMIIMLTASTCPAVRLLERGSKKRIVRLGAPSCHSAHHQLTLAVTKQIGLGVTFASSLSTAFFEVSIAAKNKGRVNMPGLESNAIVGVQDDVTAHYLALVSR